MKRYLLVLLLFSLNAYSNCLYVLEHRTTGDKLKFKCEELDKQLDAHKNTQNINEFKCTVYNDGKKSNCDDLNDLYRDMITELDRRADLVPTPISKKRAQHDN